MGLDKAKEGKRERWGERASPEQPGGLQGRGVLAWWAGRDLAEPLAGKPRGKNNLPKIAGCRGRPHLSPHGCAKTRDVFPSPSWGN